MPKQSVPKLAKAERRALEAAWASSMPTSASAIHARWWQLESWLRSLVYVELRSCYGAEWSSRLPDRSVRTRVKDVHRQRYMSTPDATDHLSYLDVGELFGVIDEEWRLFEPTLLDRDIWAARLVELNKIRRRIAHCRRPHADDLSRVEQTLRDLDEGAFRGMAAFNDTKVPDPSLQDPLVQEWGQGRYPRGHIVAHARAQYDTSFVLRYSVRPWADAPEPDRPLSGTPGVVWHAQWIGAHVPDLHEWWRDSYLDIEGWRDLIVFACAEMYSMSVSFAAVDDPLAIARGIEHCFQPTLHHRWPTESLEAAERHWREWHQRATNLDLRIQVQSGWTLITSDLWPTTIFDA